MAYKLEDLGVQAYSDKWIIFRSAKNPKTGASVALGTLSLGGFAVIDPMEQRSIQVSPSREWAAFRVGPSVWAIGQAPDSSIYFATAYNTGPDALLRWNWEGTEAEVVVELPGNHFLFLDITPDGKVYLSDYHKNALYCYDPSAGVLSKIGTFEEYGTHLGNICCGCDGWIYVHTTDYHTNYIVAIDPTGQRLPLQTGGDVSLMKDGVGHILIFYNQESEQKAFELAGGQIRPISSSDIKLTDMEIGDNGNCRTINHMPLIFDDGSYFKRINGVEITYIDADGADKSFVIEREGFPLRIFSITSGGGKIWGSTFIPLTLFSYDPSSNTNKWYGNPTRSTGEIYNSVWSEGKLFMAAYTEATLTRYNPDLPWRLDNSPEANPAHLGQMKEDPGPTLERPYGCALSPEGTVFFAARGDYGCKDSGICRIDPVTEEVTRWIYPNTTFSALIYLAKTEQLLVSETRDGEQAIRFTFVSPRTGEIDASYNGIEDGGSVVSWLHDGDDLVYGLHAWRATMIAWSLSQQKIVRRLAEMRVGTHCHNSLLFGPDKNIWGLTKECVYAVTRDFSAMEVVARYEDHAGGNSYRFGMCYGPDGQVYFPNGTHLMRIRT